MSLGESYTVGTDVVTILQVQKLKHQDDGGRLLETDESEVCRNPQQSFGKPSGDNGTDLLVLCY